MGFDIEVKGRAGQAAITGIEKINAIMELAHKIIDLESLNGRLSGLEVTTAEYHY
jgi:acetylornithine deacetylase/succinyl-diaminopimelate desuccinylase-like protein